MNNSWSMVNMDDIFMIARGGSPRPIQKFLTDDPEGINWIMIGDATEGSKYITSTKKKIIPEGVKRSRMVKEGDFLLTNSMSFGKPYIMKTSGCIHDGWLVLSPKSNQIDVNYFYHLLGSKFMYLEFTRRAAGATVKNLNIKLVKNVQVPLPPLAEQQRIAAILDTADSLRAKRRAALAKLDTLLQATFLHMFGDPDAGFPRIKVESLVEEGKGKIRTGPFGSQLLHSEFIDDPNGVMVLGIDNAVQNQFIYTNNRYISHEKYEQLRRYTVNPDDVLITIMGTCGRCSIVPQDIPLAINTKHLCCITLDQEKCLPVYLKYAFLLHPFVLKQLGISERGAVMPGLNMGIIKNLSIPLPSIEQQKEFVMFVAKQKNQNKLLSESDEDFDKLFHALQQRAFKGEL